MVAGHESLPSIDDEDEEIRRHDRAAPALEHELVQRILAGAEHAARINDIERHTAPLRLLRDHVTRRACDRRDDRAACAGDPVEQGGLADVGPAYEDDGLAFGHR